MPGLLSDNRIRSALDDGRLKIDGSGAAAVRDEFTQSSIQSASIDLHIGWLFVPQHDALNEQETPRGVRGYHLEPGGSVVVETREELTLATSLAGICFPPARLFRKGLMMTNPGHVDPGYSGKLTFTVINLGRSAYQLNWGDPIATLLLFELGSTVGKGFEASNFPNSDRSPASVSLNRIAVTLNALSPDFASFNRRALEIVRREFADFKADLEFKKIVWPVLGTVIAALIVFLGQSHSNLKNFATKDEMDSLRKDLSKIASQSNLESHPSRWEVVVNNSSTKIVEDLAAVKQRLRALENLHR